MAENKDYKPESSSEPISLDFNQFSLLDRGFGLGDIKDYRIIQRKKSLQQDKKIFDLLKAESLKEKESLEKNEDSKGNNSDKLTKTSEIEIFGPIYKKNFLKPQEKKLRFPLKPSFENLKFEKPLSKSPKENYEIPEEVKAKAKKSVSKFSSQFWLRHGFDLGIVFLLMSVQVLFLKLFFRSEDYFILDLFLGHFSPSSFTWFHLLELISLLYVCYFLYYFIFLFFVGKSLGSYFSELLQKNTHDSKKTKKVP